MVSSQRSATRSPLDISNESGKPMISNLMSASELQQRLNKSLVSSSQSLGWSGVLVQQYQYPSSSTVCEMQVPALSEHWLNLPLGNPAQCRFLSHNIPQLFSLHQKIIPDGYVHVNIQ